MLENLRNNFKKLIYNKLYCINLLLVLQTFGIKWGSFIIMEIQNNFIALVENQTSRVFITKVFEFLKNIYKNNKHIIEILARPCILVLSDYSTVERWNTKCCYSLASKTISP